VSSQQAVPEPGAAAAQQTTQQPDERQAEALAAAFGVPKEVALAALRRADAAEQISRVLEVLQKFQSLPGELRRAIAPVIGGMLLGGGGLGQMVSELLRARLAMEIAERLLGDSQPQLLRELSRLTLDLIKSQARDGSDEAIKRLEKLLVKVLKESRKSPLDRIKEVSELVNAIKALSSLLSPQPNLAEAIAVLEKYGFKVVAPQSDISELIRHAREEAYKRGLKEGFERANVLTKMFAAAMKYLGPELRQLIAVWARRMMGAAALPAGVPPARPARVPGDNTPATRQAAGKARQEYPFEV
jgi:hypothetical protein